MLPTVAIVGRPNVGKSTLFNRLVSGRRAVVDETPGTTRDRHYRETEHAGRPFLLVDTGGFEPSGRDPLRLAVRAQTELAVEEADVIIFLGDGRAGLLPDDHQIIDRLRRSGKPVVWAVTKVDSDRIAAGAYEFSEAGVGPLHLISGAHGRGVEELCDAIVQALAPVPAAVESDACEEDDADKPVRIAIVGRPNAGKSALVNRLLGSDRHLVTDIPGTTVDAIDSEVRRGEDRYCLVDTAGVRRKRSISASLEKVAVLRAFKTVRGADVAVLVIDYEAGLVEQDAKLAGLIDDTGRGMILALNKWDLAPRGSRVAKDAEQKIRDALPFAAYAEIVRCSAKTGQAVERFLTIAKAIHHERRKRVPTAELNRAFEQILARHAPPVSGTRRVRLYYITQVSLEPPTFVVQANSPDDVHFSYRRYVQNQLRARFDFAGTPIRVFYRRHRSKVASEPSSRRRKKKKRR